MSLRYAALALLSAEPMTGYDLVKLFDSSVSLLWAAPHSQIYPELRRMEAESLVTAESVARGSRSQKRVYSVTDHGLQELRRWVATPLPHQPDRSAHHLQAAYLELTSDAVATAHLTAHRDHYAARCEALQVVLAGTESGRLPLLRARLRTVAEGEQSRVTAFKRLGLEGELMRARSEVQWAEKGLALLGELGGS